MIAAEEKRIRLLEEHEEHQKNVADTIANSMGDALTSIVDGTKSVSDAFKDMARAIIAELYQIYVVKQITGMISAAIAPHVPAALVPAANGNAFSNGNVVPYADGGVVGGPVYFPMNDGRTGLMGEAGPEAIMPLKRGKNGKLGVQAEGGAGDVIIHQNFNFQANGDESVKKIIAQQAPVIANMTKKQILDDRRRGGQMKQAFG
jgi:lambda family phage tail tape measure protein